MPFAAILLSRGALELYAVIALGLLLFGLKTSYDHKHEAIGAARVQALWDTDKAARIKAFSDMTTKWITAASNADAAIKERDDARAKLLASAKNRAANLPPAIAAIPVPYQSVVVLNDAIRDSAIVASPSAKPDATAAGPSAGSNIGMLTEWGVTCIAMYDQARQRLNDWATFYQSLRDAQGKPEVSP